jgi:virulence factor Mce-like protein
MSGNGRRALIHPLIAGAVAGVLIALVVGLMATINLQYGAPWAQTHVLGAQVSDADGMSVGSDVRIAGRLAGQVTSVKAAGDHSNIVFQVDSSDWPLPADTTASVRLATLLGQKYLQLNPGHSTNAMADGAVIGIKSVRPVVDFDQILDTFDKPTRDALTRLIRTAKGGVQNNEGALQNLAAGLGDLSQHSQIPTEELVTRNPEINNILVNLGITADQLNASSDALAGTIDNLNAVTGALASSNGAALKSFIANTDALNLSTDAVLGGGSAQVFDSALQKVPTFATYLNRLLSDLIPQTATADKPVSFAEPADYIRDSFTDTGLAPQCPTGSWAPPETPPWVPATTVPPGCSNGIPLRSAIDLIYEIGNASSPAYGFNNFGTASAPNVQGNFFLRQFPVGFDNCAFGFKPHGANQHLYICMDFNLPECISKKDCITPPGPVAPPPPPVVQATPSPTPSAPAPSPCNPLFACRVGPTPTPGPSSSPGPTPTPGGTPSPLPSPSLQPVPTPTPSPTAAPTAQAMPTPTPSPSPSPSASAQLSSYPSSYVGPNAASAAAAPPQLSGYFSDFFDLGFWNALLW